MERPLHTRTLQHEQFESLARALLYAEQSVAAHRLVLQPVFGDAPLPRHLTALARRTLALAGTRPQPRLRKLQRQLLEDRYIQAFREHYPWLASPAPALPRMRPLPAVPDLPKLETTGDLAAWLRINAEELLWFADLRNLNDRTASDRVAHYERHVFTKRSGGVRLVEAPRKRLKTLQRQVLAEILDSVPLASAAHGFRRHHSILTFAHPHTGKALVLRIDLREFFPSITGSRIQALFRTLGYPEHVADLLGGLCTTATPRRFWAQCDTTPDLRETAAAYARPHLPQGAPTSGALANLCALRLDRRLAGLAAAVGASYTRYADDLAFSGDSSFARHTARFADHAAAIILDEGFTPNLRKTRVMRQPVRQHLAGLTVNRHASVSRAEFDRLKAILTNCVRHGAATQNREQHADFRRHLEGRVAFVAMVQPARAERLRALLNRIQWDEAIKINSQDDRG